MNKHKNINEEISRIKSLFTEERLYGNLINDETNYNKILVTESNGGRSKIASGIASGLSDWLWGPKLMKNKKGVITLDGNKKIKFTKNDSGDIISVTINGNKVDKNDLSNFISDDLFKKIRTQIETFDGEVENLGKYFQKGGFNGVSLENSFKEAIMGLKNIGIDDNSLRQVISRIGGTGIFNRIGKLDMDDFFNSFISMADFQLLYPDIFTIIDTIPGLKKVFFNTASEIPIRSGSYDSVVSMLHSLKDADDITSVNGKKVKVNLWKEYWDPESGKLNIKNNNLDGTVTIKRNRLDDGIRMIKVENLPSKIESELRAEIKRLKSIYPDLNISLSKEGDLTFTNIKFTKREMIEINYLVSVAPEAGAKRAIPGKSRSFKDVKWSDISDTDIDLNISVDIPDVKRFSSDKYILYDTVMGIVHNVLKDSKRIIRLVRNSNIYKRMITTITTRISEFLNPSYLIKNGYFEVTQRGLKKGIDTEWQDLLRGLWKVPGEPIDGHNTSIFISNEAEVLHYGQKMGTVKSGLVKTEKYDKVLKTQLKKWLLFGGGIKKGSTLRGIDKLKVYRNMSIKIAAATSIWAVIAYRKNIYRWFFGSVVTEAISITEEKLGGFIDVMKDKEMNPNMLVPAYKIKYIKSCKEKIKENFNLSFGDGSALAKYDSIFGDAGKYKNIWNFDWEVKNRGSGKDFFSVMSMEKVYDDKNIPTVTVTNKKIDNVDIDLSYDNIGSFFKKGDEVWFKTVISSEGKTREFPIECDPGFAKYWEESWKEMYKIKGMDNKDIKSLMLDKLGDVDWEKMYGENYLEALRDITIQDITSGVEEGFEKVKEGGIKGQEWIENQGQGGGNREGKLGDKLSY
jgi:hypothetical protein